MSKLQALALVGPAGYGKSLLQSLITVLFGGRSERAFTYLSGGTNFNLELFRAEHLMVEDEMAHRDIRSRRSLATAIKGIVANEKQRCRGMYREGIALKPFWRLSISLNDQPEDLLVLPPLDDGMRDKLILLSVRPGLAHLRIPTAEDRKRLYDALVAELPAFVWFLEHWEIPEHLRNDRYGIREFHHPKVLTALQELAPEERFFEILKTVLFGKLSCTMTDVDAMLELEAPGQFQGTALELERRLLDSDFEHEVRGLLSFNGACGTFLRRLASQYPEEVKQVTNRGRRFWRLTCLQPPDVADDQDTTSETP